MRMYPEQDGRAIVPDLNGPVAVLNNQHEVPRLTVYFSMCDRFGGAKTMSFYDA